MGGVCVCGEGGGYGGHAPGNLKKLLHFEFENTELESRAGQDQKGYRMIFASMRALGFLLRARAVRGQICRVISEHTSTYKTHTTGEQRAILVLSVSPLLLLVRLVR